MVAKDTPSTNAYRQNPCCSSLCNNPPLKSTEEASSSKVGEMQSTSSSSKFNIGEEPHSSLDEKFSNCNQRQKHPQQGQGMCK